MSRYLGRALKVHLKLHNSVRTTNQNYCSISYSITSDCYNKKYKRSDLLGSVCSGQLQSRNFSFQSIGELNASIYNFVVASEPSIALKYALISFHDTTGLPWWSTIILTTAMVKWGIGLPLQICQHHVMAKIRLAKEEFDKAVKELEPEILLQARRGKWSERQKKRMKVIKSRKIWKDLITKNNCHPFKTIILAWAQFPPWLLFSFTLRNLVESTSNSSAHIHTALQLQSEGLLWQTNLMLPDTTYILPGILGLSIFALVEINLLTSPGVRGLMAKIVTVIFKSLALLSFFVAAQVPTSVSLYWATSVLFSVCHILMLQSPKVRRFFGIPITPHEVQTPYSNLVKKFKEKYTKLPYFFKKPQI